MSTLALIENGRTFIGTAQLQCVEANLFPATLLASVGNDGMLLHICVVDGLHFGALRT